MFHVGQKVICVNQRWATIDKRRPEKGCIYTIREIYTNGKDVGFRFFEITNPPRQHADGFAESAWHSRFFRPVIERKTDISIFQRMLVPAGKRKLVAQSQG